MTVGPAPCCSTARSAAAPVAKSGNRNASCRTVCGTGWIRSRTRVHTPKAPSDPISHCRRSGPAADAGARPASITPIGVTTVSPRTISSKRPYPAEACPDERVIAYPPRVAYGKDCGKWPSEKPCSANNSSARGPDRPAPRTASPESGSIDSRESKCARSTEITARWPPASGVRPPTTEVPPPKGTIATPSRPHHASRAATSSSSRGATTASGQSTSGRSRQDSRSGVDLPLARGSRWASAVERLPSPTMSARAVRSAWVSRDGEATTAAGSKCRPLSAVTPSTSRSRPRMPSPRSLASASVPHRDRAMGGNGRLSEEVMSLILEQ